MGGCIKMYQRSSYHPIVMDQEPKPSSALTLSGLSSETSGLPGEVTIYPTSRPKMQHGILHAQRWRHCYLVTRLEGLGYLPTRANPP